MWPKSYKDYKQDDFLTKHPVEPGKGIVGCEMHEINGWGNSLHMYKQKRKGFVRTMLESVFRYFQK